MASREYVTGLGAQRPYDQGLTEAKPAAYALLGKPAPPYVALDALPSRATNCSTREVYRDEPPPEVVESFEVGAAMTAEVNNTEEARASSTNPVEMRGID
jgi:ribose transport system substrate-binding protein